MSGELIAWGAFAFGVAWVFYAYLGYPLALQLVRRFAGRPVDIGTGDDDGGLPRLSVVVAVHNGASQIRDKLENLLAQDYPRELVEIIVTDDASEDETDRIVREEYASRGVVLLRQSERGGKERAQKLAVARVTGEIIVFTDVGLRTEARGLREIVRPFADPSVGCVSSVDRVGAEAGRDSGEGMYVRYEMALRKLESEVRSLVGVSGSFFAVRRELCEDFSETLPSDFRCVLVTVRNGLRAVPAESAVGFYADVAPGSVSRQRRVRTILRGITAVFQERRMLNPLRFGLFAWQLWSHKVVRWSVPFGLLLTLGASSWLALGSRVFAIILAVQLLGYAYAAVVLMSSSPPSHRVGRLVRYLSEANVAALVAWLRFLRGDRVVLWKPTKR